MLRLLWSKWIPENTSKLPESWKEFKYLALPLEEALESMENRRYNENKSFQFNNE